MSLEMKEERNQLLRESVRRIVSTKLARRAAEIDEAGVFPWDIAELFAQQGYLSVMLPESYGGMDGDITAFCIIAEEVACACGSSSLMILAHSVGLMPLMVAGNEEQNKRFYERVSNDHALAGFAMTEPEAGSDASAIKTTAVLEGDYYILNGRKCFVTNGGAADLYAVFVTTRPGERTRGISVFMVEKDTTGLTIGKREEKLGMRGSDTTDLIFENAVVAKENLVGEEGGGWEIAMMTLNLSRPAIGATAIGIAQGAIDFALDYATKRVQFGQKLADFQGVQFMLADMAMQIEAARALVYKAAALLDQKIYERDRMSAIGVDKLSAMAKCFASDVAMRVTTDAVQILGGYGYLKDYPVERMMRDAKVTQIFEGSNQIQRVIIARDLLKKFWDKDLA
ncbi:MAG: acyl-CoA dehydrogenase family protein [Deltaproteobacteria bacterium]|nr:MAG: acyl-CoA dehydrogenase family protein [Deltaproteobacteria bacterium]